MALDARFRYASLSIFWAPHIGTMSIFDELEHMGEGSPGEVEAYVGSLPAAQRRNVVGALTSLVHETRHFHDMLLSPWGWRTWIFHVDRIRRTLHLLNELMERGVSRVEAPIRTDDPALQALLGEIAAAKERAEGWTRRGLPLLEAHAYWTAGQYARQYLGAAAEEAYGDTVLPSRHGGLVWELGELGRQLDGSSPDEFAAEEHKSGAWADTVHRLVIGCLAATQDPEARFAEILGAIRQAELDLRQAVVMTGALVGDLLEYWAADRRWLDQQGLSAFAREVEQDPLLTDDQRRALLEVVGAFAELIAAVRGAAHAEPELCAAPDVYLRHVAEDRPAGAPALPLPRLYMTFASNVAEVGWGEPTFSAEEFWDVEVYREHVPRWVRSRLPDSPTTGPAGVVFARPWPAPFRGDPIDPLWGRFARDIEGVTVLADGDPGSDPVVRQWARRCPDRYGFEVTRRPAYG